VGVGTLNILVVIEDQKTKDRHANTFSSALDVRCPCGGFIHPILGAWCVLCGAKVVEIQEVG
jgi:hypothetical protein